MLEMEENENEIKVKVMKQSQMVRLGCSRQIIKLEMYIFTTRKLFWKDQQGVQLHCDVSFRA